MLITNPYSQYDIVDYGIWIVGTFDTAFLLRDAVIVVDLVNITQVPKFAIFLFRLFLKKFQC
jgi:hypothetical protein